MAKKGKKKKVEEDEVETPKPKKGKGKGKKEPKGPKPAEDKKRGATGQTWGLNVGQTWLRMLEQNSRKKMVDSEMAEFMQEEFPANKDYTVADIKLHRNLFNRGRIRDQEPFGKELPDDDKLHEYQEKDGKLIKLPLRAPKVAAKKKGKKKKTEDVAEDAEFEDDDDEEEDEEEEEEEEEDEVDEPEPKPKKKKRRRAA